MPPLSILRVPLAVVAAMGGTACDRTAEPGQVRGSLEVESSGGGAVRTITGKVDPASASIALADAGGKRTARVNVARDGRFRAVLADLPRGETVTFRLTATAGRARPWRRTIAASGGAAGAGPTDVRVPARDSSPPTAILLLRSGGRVVSSISPVRDDAGAPVRLPRRSLALTALIRDGDGGTGRVRASLVYTRICVDPATGRRTARRTTLHFPPSEIARVKLPPGATAPRERRRRARVRLELGPGCLVRGKTWADATNASGLESFSDQIPFSLRG